MLQINYQYDDKSVVFSAVESVPGKYFRLRQKLKAVKNVDAWVSGNLARCDAIAALRVYGEENPEAIRFEDGRIIASHAAVARLSDNQARALHLPGVPPYVLASNTHVIIGSSSFMLTTEWLQHGEAVATSQVGAFLETADGTFRIPEPLFSAIEQTAVYKSETADLPTQWDALSRFRKLLEPDTDGEISKVEMSKFLQGLRVYTGAALSLAIKGDTSDIDFDPVLYSNDTVRKAKDEGRPVSEQDGILPQELCKKFQGAPDTGFRAFASAKRSYLLGGNTYLTIDEDLEAALQVVREKQQGDLATRRAFATNPHAAILERMIEQAQDKQTEDGLNENIEARTETVLIETPEYIDRATGIGLWETPALNFVPETRSVWLPEIFTLDLGGVWVRIDKDTIQTLREKIVAGRKDRQTQIRHEGQDIPVTEEVIKTLEETIGRIEPQETSEESGEGETEHERATKPIVVHVHENFVEENWQPKTPPRTALIPADTPESISTPLLSHQKKGLQWQIEAWKSGISGILNADDQGLGKTLQTLAFLAWLQSNMNTDTATRRKPILVVAPTGLLQTWEEEVNQHLAGFQLGVIIRAYGKNLRALKVPKATGRDTDDGKPRLTFGSLHEAMAGGTGNYRWILTTYETLKNYQHSFRRIHFSAAVFDEIQKIKNPQTLTACAARAIVADFRIGLTGTPIENHVMDLWAIVDVLAPGRLEPLKEFISQYRTITREKMHELHGRLFKPVHNNGKQYPPIAQRRFKDEEIENLPRKDYRVYYNTMPTAQAEAYNKARQLLIGGARGSTLKLLHHIRTISLHPTRPENLHANIQDYFAQSARFTALQHLLAKIHSRKERALIFTEDRRIQAFIAQWIRSEFKLNNIRIINGAVAPKKRQEYVKQFQKNLSSPGFDVMILSPRAAGVGLTLTAATNVIHLSRWWNPAVEEQCNDRIYRIGQKHDVTIHLPLAIHPEYRESSFDCILNNLMRRKTSLARAALWPPTDNDYDMGMLVTGISDADLINLEKIDNFNWQEFEDWVMQRAQENGEWKVSETPSSGDAGADVVLEHRQRDTSALVQVKHTSGRSRRIDENAVREVMHAVGRYKINNPQLVVITNAYDFTARARNTALENDVKLVDRNHLGLWPNHVLG